MEPTQKYDDIISSIDMDPIYHEISKKTHHDASTELDYDVKIISVFIHYVERIPTIKDLVKRLRDDIAFKINCGFLVSDEIPSESSYSRLLTKLSESNVLVKAQETLILQAIQEGYIVDETISIDATHFEARDQAPPKKEKIKSEPKKRGRKPKAEREQRSEERR